MKTALVVALLLTGCASLPQGLEMTDDDRKACAAEGCTAWTLDELKKLVGVALRQGFRDGQKRRGELSL